MGAALGWGAVAAASLVLGALLGLARRWPDRAVGAAIIMPELIFSGSQTILHNQRALYIKRLLLFEPGVILTSVPFHLR